MWVIAGATFGMGLVGLIAYMARENGKQAIRLDALKKSARQAAYVQQIQNRIKRLPVDDVYERLYHPKH